MSGKYGNITYILYGIGGVVETMLFDKDLFESKYVPIEQRTPVDTLILIGNGFDIWQNLDTSLSLIHI